jgi:hypothetical protein
VPFYKKTIAKSEERVVAVCPTNKAVKVEVLVGAVESDTEIYVVEEKKRKNARGNKNSTHTYTYEVQVKGLLILLFNLLLVRRL